MSGARGEHARGRGRSAAAPGPGEYPRRGADLEPEGEAWVSLVDWLELPGEELLRRYERLYVPDRDPRYLRRNALIALGNGAEEYRELARPFADSGDPILAPAARRALR